MKLRIKDDSVRLRLTQSEVEELALQGKYFSNCQIIKGKEELRYGIEATREEAASIRFSQGILCAYVPADKITEWAESEQIGISEEIENRGDMLSLLIEKDFTCLTSRPSEDESDNYPNPLAKHGHD